MKVIYELNTDDDDFYNSKDLLDNALKNSAFKDNVFNFIRSIQKYGTLNGVSFEELSQYEAIEELQKQLLIELEY